MTKERICNHSYHFSVFITGDILIFKIKECEIEISFLFLLVLSVASLFGSSDVIYILIFSILHELGHLICLIVCGGKPSKLTLSYYGFALKYESLLDTKKEALVISGGCIMNLILYIFLKDKYNLVLFALNILPIYPLDGGRIVMLYFPKISKPLSIFMLCVASVASVYLLITYKSFSLILIVAYLAAYCVNY